jgi:hypothetical protein
LELSPGVYSFPPQAVSVGLLKHRSSGIAQVEGNSSGRIDS